VGVVLPVHARSILCNRVFPTLVGVVLPLFGSRAVLEVRLPHASGGGPDVVYLTSQLAAVFPTLVGVVRLPFGALRCFAAVFPTLVGVVRVPETAKNRSTIGLPHASGGGPGTGHPWTPLRIVFPTLVGVVRIPLRLLRLLWPVFPTLVGVVP